MIGGQELLEGEVPKLILSLIRQVSEQAAFGLNALELPVHQAAKRRAALGALMVDGLLQNRRRLLKAQVGRFD